MNRRNELIFLDFDGVICDSIRECFVSSWYAYYRYLGTTPPDSISLEHKAVFYAARPYIRIGEDYVLLHALILYGRRIGSQDEFDSYRERCGRDVLDGYKRNLLDVRENALRTGKEAWIALHSLYEGLEPLLVKAASNETFYILSTKKASLIAEILGAFGIEWPSERILYSGSENKNDFILELMSRKEAGEAVFIDDQKDHFTHIEDGRIRCVLASWGYIQKSWLEKNGAESMELHEFRRFLSSRLEG